MTVKELIKILQKCPQDMEVTVHSESNDFPIGTNYSPIYINKQNELCLFCDVDEKEYVKSYLSQQNLYILHADHYNKERN